ncbi:MAG: hypothetical protein FJ125_14715, partial [Deltaproteobacteria bacterium]|nr:hypothetical protein [Deltaproteobacteria bacterium]
GRGRDRGGRTSCAGRGRGHGHGHGHGYGYGYGYGYGRQPWRHGRHGRPSASRAGTPGGRPTQSRRRGGWAASGPCREQQQGGRIGRVGQPGAASRDGQGPRCRRHGRGSATARAGLLPAGGLLQRRSPPRTGCPAPPALSSGGREVIHVQAASFAPFALVAGSRLALPLPPGQGPAAGPGLARRSCRSTGPAASPRLARCRCGGDGPAGPAGPAFPHGRGSGGQVPRLLHRGGRRGAA